MGCVNIALHTQSYAFYISFSSSIYHRERRSVQTCSQLLSHQYLNEMRGGEGNVESNELNEKMPTPWVASKSTETDRHINPSSAWQMQEAFPRQARIDCRYSFEKESVWLRKAGPPCCTSRSAPWQRSRSTGRWWSRREGYRCRSRLRP